MNRTNKKPKESLLPWERRFGFRQLYLWEDEKMMVYEEIDERRREKILSAVFYILSVVFYILIALAIITTTFQAGRFYGSREERANLTYAMDAVDEWRLELMKGREE